MEQPEAVPLQNSATLDWEKYRDKLSKNFFKIKQESLTTKNVGFRSQICE